MPETSIVEYFPSHESDEGSRCAYCKTGNGAYLNWMWAQTLTPLDYQNLIDRGWRRSGKTLYKPTMHLTCCSQYTIRCEAKRFSLSRSQKKVLKKVHKFLAHGDQERSVSSQPSERSEQAVDVSDTHEAMDAQMLKDMKKVSQISRLDMVAVDTDKPCRKAKEIRSERKFQKLLKKGIPADVALSSLQKKRSEPKTVENFINEPFPTEPVHKLELRLVPSDSDECKSTLDESFNVYKKYQMKIHNDTEEDCGDRESYEAFLVDAPFERPEGASSEASRYGLFHHQYWLNGKLIAVGVLDILPYSVSSVYFYYDPDYDFLSLGTYAALREIALTRELNKTYPNLQYYYMGFYIHSCVKMRYKGQFYPSYLLCPETYIFQPIEKCIPKLKASKYHRLEEDLDKEDNDGVVSLSEVRILYNHERMTYESYSTTVREEASDEKLVREYAGLVGMKCYKRMLLDLSEPDISEPDTSEPDISEPDISEPDTSEPDTSEPDISELDIS